MKIEVRPSVVLITGASGGIGRAISLAYARRKVRLVLAARNESSLESVGREAIVNMSSVMGRKAFARFRSYAIAMHAVSALSDALRQELTGTGVHVSVIHPALTATDLLRETPESEMPPAFRFMTPLTPERVAQATLNAVDRRHRRTVLPWQANMLRFGEAMSPRIGDTIAGALTIHTIARLLGLSSGPSYHAAIGHLTAEYGGLTKTE